MALRLLISGSLKNKNTIASFIVKHFDNTIEWEFLKFHDEFSDMMKSTFNKVLYRALPFIFTSRMNRSFVRQVQEFKPEMVLVFKGMEITKSSLKEIRFMGIKTVNYNFDHPFKFFSSGTGNNFVKEAIPFYDLHITYSTVIASDLEKQYGLRSAVLPFGFSLTPEEFAIVTNDEKPEIVRACFVGNPDHLRIKWIKDLLAEGIAMDVYGFGWEKYFDPNDLLRIHPPQKPLSYWADPLDFWRVLRRYRIQLNFLRPHNEGSHNLRSFEIPGAGGILLAPDSGEHRSFFTPDKEIFLYTDFNSCVAQIRHLLSLNSDDVTRIREAARQRAVQNKYSYKDRTKQLLDILKTV